MIVFSSFYSQFVQLLLSLKMTILRMSSLLITYTTEEKTMGYNKKGLLFVV